VLLDTARQTAGTLSELGIDIGMFEDAAQPQIVLMAVLAAIL
jgi:hypothetical protein